METFYYNLSGGINQASTKTELGLNTKNIFWSDAENVEIFLNKGIIRQKGNVLYCEIPITEPITKLHEFGSSSNNRLLITTASGKIYIYNPKSDSFTELERTLKSQLPVFTNFLNGVIISSLLDKMFYIKQNGEIVDCEVKDGLQAGDKVAVSKLRFLSDGMPVDIISQKEKRTVAAQK